MATWARPVPFRVDQLRVVLGACGLSLMQLREQKARIDSCEHIALVDLLALGEDDLHDLPADAGFDGNGVVRLDDADTLQCNGYIPAFGGYHDHGCSWRRRTAERLRLRPLRVKEIPAGSVDCRDNQDPHYHPRSRTGTGPPV